MFRVTSDVSICLAIVQALGYTPYECITINWVYVMINVHIKHVEWSSDSTDNLHLKSENYNKFVVEGKAASFT